MGVKSAIINCFSFVFLIIMKTSLNHLPPGKREQILEIVSIIKEVVAPEKIILFGSYAKGKYVQLFFLQIL